MDEAEAERCHKLAYIAYGNLISTGSIEDVITREGLTTWKIIGPDISALAVKLRQDKAVEQALVFGRTLQITGKATEQLAQIAKMLEATGQYQVSQGNIRLEDVFVHMMGQAFDNYGNVS